MQANKYYGTNKNLKQLVHHKISRFMASRAPARDLAILKIESPGNSNYYSH